MTAHHGIGSAIVLVGLVLAGARADDQIDQLHAQFPTDLINRHGYSDYTDPVGRFLDLLAAGAFDEAKAIQPDACATWASTRQTSAFSGKVWITNTMVSLDTLCAKPK
jgi:hypothetical protein